MGGLIGFYAPPEEGGPGRFWSAGYNYDTEEPYFETTPGFEAVIARALDASQEQPPELASRIQVTRPDRGLPRSTMIGASAAVALAVLVGVSVRTLVRRRD